MPREGLSWIPVDDNGKPKDATSREEVRSQSHKKRSSKMKSGSPGCKISKVSKMKARTVERANGSRTIIRRQVQHEAQTGRSFEDPKRMAEMLLLCGRYLNWLDPERIHTDADFALQAAKYGLPEPLVLAAKYLAAVRHLDADTLSGGKNIDSYLSQKAEILGALAERMASSESAYTMQSINATLGLLHFDLCEGNEEAFIHLRGLRSMMSLPHHIPAWQSSGAVMSLEMGEIMYALLWRKPLHAVLVEDQVDRPAFSIHHVHVMAQELQVTEQQLGWPMHGIATLASNAAKLMEVSLGAVPHRLPTEGPSFEQFESALKESANDVSATSTNADRLNSANRAMVAILYHFVVHQIPMADARNQNSVEKIFDATRAMTDTSWKHLRYFRLFMLSTAASAAAEPSRRSFFEAHLARGMLQLGDSKWPKTRVFMEKFIQNGQLASAE